MMSEASSPYLSSPGSSADSTTFLCGYPVDTGQQAFLHRPYSKIPQYSLLSLQKFALKHCFKFFFGLPLVYFRFFSLRSPMAQRMVKLLARALPVRSPRGRGEGGGRGYSEFQLTGMIEYGPRSKPQKIPRASNKNLNQKLTPKKSREEFPSLKNC